MCSALFWIIAFNPAIEIINKAGLNGNGFADDCGVVVGGTNFESMLSRLQVMLNELVVWGKTCGLSFNASKTAVIHFSRRLKTPSFWLSMEGQILKYSDSTKYLGVILDRELKWKAHAENKIKKSKKLLAKLLGIARSNIGPKASLMKWTYEGIVRPGLGYAAMIWTHKLKTARIQTELKKLDRLAILSFAQVKRPTPTEGLRIIYDIIPAHLHLEMVGLASYIRQYSFLSALWRGSTNKKTFNISHLKHWDLLQSKAKLETENTDKHKCRLWDKNFIVVKTSFQSSVLPDCKGCLLYTSPSPRDS